MIPFLDENHIACLEKVELECESQEYEEGCFKMGCFYCCPLSVHEELYNAQSTFCFAILFVVTVNSIVCRELQNPIGPNKKDALQCCYGFMQWDLPRREVVSDNRYVPIIDFWRVYVNGKYWGKTKTRSFCLRKSRSEKWSEK